MAAMSVLQCNFASGPPVSRLSPGVNPHSSLRITALQQISRTPLCPQTQETCTESIRDGPHRCSSRVCSPRLLAFNKDKRHRVIRSGFLSGGSIGGTFRDSVFGQKGPVSALAARRKPRSGVTVAATGPLVGADAGGALWAVLAAAAAAGQVLENRTKWGSSVSAPLLTMGVTIALAWTGVIPTSAPTYELVWSSIMPLAVCLFLLETDVRKVFSDAGSTLKAFVLGAVGTVLGTVIGFALVGRWMGSDGWKMAACLCASYVGGSINYAATAQALGVASGACLAAGMAADNLAMAAYFGVLMSWPTDDIPDATRKPLEASESPETLFEKSGSGLAGGLKKTERLQTNGLLLDGRADSGSSGRSYSSDVALPNDTWSDQEEGSSRRRTAAEASVSGRDSENGRVGGEGQGRSKQQREKLHQSAPSGGKAGLVSRSGQTESLVGAGLRLGGTNAVDSSQARGESGALRSELEHEKRSEFGGVEVKGRGERSRYEDGAADSNGTRTGTLIGNGTGSGNGNVNGNGIGRRSAGKAGYGLKDQSEKEAGDRHENGNGNDIVTNHMSREDGASITAGATDDELESRARPSAESVSLSLAAAAVSCCSGQALAAALPPAFAGTELALMAVIASLTSIAVGHVTSGGKKSGPHIAAFAGAETIGGALMQIFFAVVGATASLQEAINGGWPLLVFILTLLTVHVAFIAVLGSKVFGLPIRSVLIASNANVGGPATAAAMASAKGWPDMVRGALLTGTLGYTVGTAIGCLVGALLRGM